MAVSINGKVYTDHPLMDEICYHCKRILKDIVIKNDVLANDKETTNSVQNAEMLFLYKKYGIISFSLYPYDETLLRSFSDAYGKDYSDREIKSFLNDRNNIPVEDRDDLEEYANQYFLDNYFYEDGTFIEENDYYRMLMGLPPFNSGSDYYITIQKSDVPVEYYSYLVKNEDGNYYLHEQNTKVTTILYSNGVIDKLRKKYPSSNYSYMLFLGDRSIDCYTARKAAKWDILYMPNVYYLVEDRFTSLYKINRDMYVSKYQNFYAESGEYYDQMMIVIVLAETFNNMITDTPEWYIRRDIFDIKSCQYFLESYGVEFFKEIPLKYQIRIVKNINILIKYKSSNKNIDDILDVFSTPNMNVRKYWLYKNTTDESDPKLEFISSKIYESYNDYIRNASNRVPYDDITLQDKYWDGGQDHDLVKQRILDLDFTIKGTKYMSVEHHISLSEYLKQIEYFVGIILDSESNFDDLTIGIPTIDATANFKLSNLFLYLVILTYTFNRHDLSDDTTKVRFPFEFEGDEPILNEDYYNWKKKYLPEIYVPRIGRVYSFNGGKDFSIDKVIDVMRRRHTHLRFGQTDIDGIYTDEEYIAKADEWINSFNIRDYIDPAQKYNTIGDIVHVYQNNIDIYDKVRDGIHSADNEDDERVLEYVFEELFTKKFDKDMYKVKGDYVEDLIDLLKDKDYVLYNNYKSIINESNIESRRDNTRIIMNDIIDTLSYYTQNYDGIEYIFAFTSTQGFPSMVYYIWLLCNFFKSFKVYFLDPYVTYYADDIIDNNGRPIDGISSWTFQKEKLDKAYISDTIGRINLDIWHRDDAFRYGNYEEVDIYSHLDISDLDDQDYDGYTPEEVERTFDLDGGGVEANQNVPRIMANAGTAGRGVDLSEIDGGGPDVYNRTYYQIDGGDVLHLPQSKRTDSNGSQMFNYMIDGGGVDGRKFINNMIESHFEGNILFSDLFISPRSSEYVEIKDDGLYISDDLFPSNTQFQTLKHSLDEVISQIEGKAEAVMEAIRMAENTQLLENRIHNCVDAVTDNFEFVNNQIRNDRFIKDNKHMVRELCDALKTEMADKLNPFEWEDL